MKYFHGFSLENEEYLTSAHNLIIKADYLLKNINLDDFVQAA